MSNVLLTDILDRFSPRGSEESSHPGRGGGESSFGPLLPQARPADALDGGASVGALHRMMCTLSMLPDSLFCGWVV